MHLIWFDSLRDLALVVGRRTSEVGHRASDVGGFRTGNFFVSTPVCTGPEKNRAYNDRIKMVRFGRVGGVGSVGGVVVVGVSVPLLDLMALNFPMMPLVNFFMGDCKLLYSREVFFALNPLPIHPTYCCVSFPQMVLLGFFHALFCVLGNKLTPSSR